MHRDTHTVEQANSFCCEIWKSLQFKLLMSEPQWSASTRNAMDSHLLQTSWSSCYRMDSETRPSTRKGCAHPYQAQRRRTWQHHGAHGNRAVLEPWSSREWNCWQICRCCHHHTHGWPHQSGCPLQRLVRSCWLGTWRRNIVSDGFDSCLQKGLNQRENSWTMKENL